MSASLSGVFSLQQFTDLGLLGAGMRLYTYAPATTTQKVAYTDAAGTIPHTYTSDGIGGQYIALNSRGELPAPLFLTSGGYDLALKTAAGVTVWTRRAVGIDDAGLAATAQLRTDLADVSDAAKNAGIPSFDFELNYATDSLGWAIKQTGIRADLLGAKGDGTTDSTGAILLAMSLSTTGTVILGVGTYLVGQLSVPVGCSIRGAGLSSTVLKLKTGTNPVGGLLETPNFSSLTGTTSLGGWFNNQISDLTIDGNKAGNASGYGIRIYGKSFRLKNIRVQNCAEVGIYTEYAGGDDFTTPTKNLEATLSNVSVLLCGGDGIVTKGPHDMIVNNIVVYSCTGWGWNNQTPVNGHHVNTFLCTSGGLWAHSGGTFAGSNWIGSTAAGWGALLETGGNNITAGSFGGPIALEIRANNNRISGVVANSTTAGVKLNGASAQARLDLVMFNNTGFHFDVAGASLKSIVNAFVGDALGTLQNAAFPGDWQIVGYSGFTGALNQLEGTTYFGGGRVCLPSTGYVSQTTRGIFYDTSAPASGTFNRGDRVFNSNPAAGSPKAWACTVSGSPGTWVSEGNL